MLEQIDGQLCQPLRQFRNALAIGHLLPQMNTLGCRTKNALSQRLNLLQQSGRQPIQGSFRSQRREQLLHQFINTCYKRLAGSGKLTTLLASKPSQMLAVDLN
ncbi:hypothetical protein D3C76_1581710 [compost metagenome]